jgi:hypothetical protein
MILAAAAVVFEYRIERREAAIVHVRCGDFDVAQRRRLEVPHVARAERDVADAAVGVLRVIVEAGVHRLGHDEVRFLIGEVAQRAVAEE